MRDGKKLNHDLKQSLLRRLFFLSSLILSVVVLSRLAPDIQVATTPTTLMAYMNFTFVPILLLSPVLRLFSSHNNSHFGWLLPEGIALWQFVVVKCLLSFAHEVTSPVLKRLGMGESISSSLALGLLVSLALFYSASVLSPFVQKWIEGNREIALAPINVKKNEHD
jgi:hypothetical protein